MHERFDELKTRLAESTACAEALGCSSGDQNRDAARRQGQFEANGLTTLDRIAHEKFVADKVDNMDDLAEYERELDYDSDDASLIRTTRAATTTRLAACPRSSPPR